MLFLPAAALCCLCSALAAMAQQLIQDQVSLTRRAGESVSFSCEGTQECEKKQVYWYQKTDTDPLRVILRVDLNDGKVHSRYNHPQKDDFSALRKMRGCELMITRIQLLHSATYYCSCWKEVGGNSESNRHLVFGSGTRLKVTNEHVVKPVVSVYPGASRAQLGGRSSLLCVAKDMFPPLVRFSLKRRKEGGRLEELPNAEQERLELGESECAAAILWIRHQDSRTSNFSCSVQHEGGTVEAEREVLAPKTSAPTPPTAPSPPSSPPAAAAAAASFEFQCRVKLLCAQYTVLIVKSLLFCCGLSLLMILRNKPPSTS